MPRSLLLPTRAKLLREVHAALESRQPVGVVGPGGIGKTHLARRIEPETAVFVACQGAHDTDDFTRLLADALGTTTTRATGADLARLGHRAGRRVVVLDNCEQAPDAARQVVRGLTAVGARVVYTSRVPLPESGVIVSVVPLGVDEACRLFFERADRDTVDAGRDRDIVIELASLVGCNPLAVELLAAHTALSSVVDLLGRVRSHADLTSLSDDRPTRQGSLHALVLGTYPYLSSPEQRALKTVAHLRGSWSASDAQALGVEPRTLAALTRWSLVHRQTHPVRFRVFELVRSAVLTHHPPEPPIRRGVAAWLDRAAEGPSSELRHARSDDAQEWLEARFEDARQAVGDSTVAPQLRLRIALTWARFQSTRHSRAVLAILEPVRDLRTDDAELDGSVALIRASNLRRSGDLVGASEVLERAIPASADHGVQAALRAERAWLWMAGSGRSRGLDEARAAAGLPDPGSWRPQVLRVLGTALRVNHRQAEARTVLEEAATEASRLSQVGQEIQALCQLSQLDFEVGPEEALALLERAAELCAPGSNRATVVQSYFASRLMLDDRLDQARPHLESACRGFLLRGDPRSASNLRSQFELLEALQLEPDDALARLRAQLTSARELQISQYQPALLLGIGVAHHRVDQVDRALACYRDAERDAKRLDRLGAGNCSRNLQALALAELGHDSGSDDALTAAAIAAHRTGDTAALLRELEAGRGAWYLERMLRHIARRALRAVMSWRIGPDGRRFVKPDGVEVDLGRRGAPRRILAALAAERTRNPGHPLTADTLIEYGWPGERILPAAAQSRLWSAIRTLRSIGLSEILQTVDDGYRLDPNTAVAVDES